MVECFSCCECFLPCGSVPAAHLLTPLLLPPHVGLVVVEAGGTCMLTPIAARLVHLCMWTECHGNTRRSGTAGTAAAAGIIICCEGVLQSHAHCVHVDHTVNM